MSATPSSLSEGDLHGLIDGHLEGSRRAEVLRRVASSPDDRDKIEAWQDQADQVRAAFRGIDKEPLPSTLDLRPVPKLHCVPPARIAAANANDPQRSKTGRRILAGSGTTFIVAAGLAGSWFIAGVPEKPKPADSIPVEVISESPDDVLARRTEGALAATRGGMASPRDVTAMPTTSIPDLTPVGFTFSGAEAQTGGPVSVVFRYQNASAERVVIGVARAPYSSREEMPAARNNALTWHLGVRAFAIAGTVAPKRLRAIAASLRAASVEE